MLASNGLNAQDLADSVAVGRVAELTEHSIQNSKNSLNLARFWWDEGLAERVGFEPTVEFPLHTLSKRAPSTTRTSLPFDSHAQANPSAHGARS